MKLCKDCANLDPHSSKYSMCLSPQARRNLVTGHAFCDFERTYGYPCGLDGALFEPKPVKAMWLKRIFS